ncbi:GDSL esterase/lipase at1g71250 [Phtheirospermum japonicum]|uniref:GDSL esterase/lipase at1g71250 n=1 Tax=Phtheirospermum japonicum TaxID=374723 RepID=A0A830AY65_9LAMI|nr:GDSL esterase/lipase at1g71250 [Phtheirospermum japonicum]
MCVTGFTVKDKACCGIGNNRGKPVCLPDAEPCFNREQYLFWDSAHPTQAANRNFAYRVFGLIKNSNVLRSNQSGLSYMNLAQRE